MSDYGDDSDYEVDWMWIEEEYSIADDLAEHAVQSPPPTLCIDDEMVEWDRYDYFNDLEYDSDGFDEAKFVPHNSKDAKVTQRTGHKRKRNGSSQRERKRSKVAGSPAESVPGPVMPPVTWRSHGTPAVPVVKGESLKAYGFLKDWKRTMPKTPTWATAASKSEHSRQASEGAAQLLKNVHGELEDAHNELEDVDDGQEDGSAETGAIDSAALMAALQKNLAAAGGPLNGMDPQQLLEFAMRMMTDQSAGDKIAGELADNMFQGDGEDGEDGEDDTELMSWLARHREPAQADMDPVLADEDGGDSSNHKRVDHRPPKSSLLKTVQNTDDMEQLQAPSRKRKADEDGQDDEVLTAPKKRATRSNDATVRGNQARPELSATRNTRSGRTKRT